MADQKKESSPNSSVKIGLFSAHGYDRQFFDSENKKHNFDIHYFETKLDERHVKLAEGYEVICAFVHDDLNAKVLQALAAGGTKVIAMRCAGFNNVDLDKAKELNMTVVRVPAYSPYAVAEHAVALAMTLNRKTHKAYNKTREGNFLLEGLLGFDMNGKTVGVIGTGKIGAIFAKIMKQGFNCNVVAYDPYQSDAVKQMGIPYVSLDELYAQADIISIHVPLTKDNLHMIGDEAIKKMKKGVMIINTSRGPLMDTKAAINGLKTGQIGYLGLDVYEEEDDLFFEDFSDKIIQDDTFSRLQTFPNVLVTAHQAFFTQTALTQIASTTLTNVVDFKQGTPKKENMVSKM